MFTRPKVGESEEEILVGQEEFIQETRANKRFEPAAKLVNPKKHAADQFTHKEAKHPKLDDAADEDVESAGTSKREDADDDKVYYPQPVGSILGDIIEKNVDTSFLNLKLSNDRDDENANPKPMSIFAQRMRDKKNKNSESTTAKIVQTVQTLSTSKLNIPERSLILKGKDSMQIHLENKSMLEKMSEDEILKERQKLISQIDSKTLDYIRSLRMNNDGKSETSCGVKKSTKKVTFSDVEVMDTTNKGEELPKVEKMDTSDVINEGLYETDIFSHPDMENWVHFDTLEKDKLEWIKNFKSIDVEIGNDPYEARFDFKGYLLPYSVEYNEQNKTLFHHGADPHRPGYTLGELFQLCRSTVIQQRSLALNTIAGLLEYHSLGIYDKIIDVPVTKIYFVLRFAVDENVPIILEPALKGLRNMIYNRVDESCLDNFLCIDDCLVQPGLIADKSEETESETDELKDFHLTDLDIIGGFLRTDMLSRIRYILNTVKPAFTSVEYCIQILIRIARDSLENAEKIMQTEGLLDSIFRNCLPEVISDRGSAQNNTEYHVLIIDSLKLVRVLISQSVKIANELVLKHGILASLLNYINKTADTVYYLKIQIEVYYILSILLKYEVGLEKLTGVQQLIFNTVNKHLNITNILSSQTNVFYLYASALFTLLNYILSVDNHNFELINNNERTLLGDLLILCLIKCCSEIGHVEDRSGVKLNFIASIFRCVNTYISQKRDINHHELNNLNKTIDNMIQFRNFQNVLNESVRCSNLLSRCPQLYDENGSNLSKLCSALLDTSHKLQPILNRNSPFPFVSAVCKYLKMCGEPRTVKSLLEKANILKYLTNINEAKPVNLSDSWFTRIELRALFDLIELSTGHVCSESTRALIYNVAFKLSYILTSEFKPELRFLFNTVIFNKEWFTADSLLQNLNINESNDLLNDLNIIQDCYMNCLKLDVCRERCNFVVFDWKRTILPRDWIYMPILGLYAKNDQSRVESPQNELLIKNIILCCLKWILVSEIYFPDITNEIKLTDRFCRLLCIFLCDNSIFLDASVKLFLQKCIRVIFDLERSLPKPKRLNFDSPLLGIANFQDLYMQLIDQYQAVSYCDPLFASCVLVPLSQKHNIKWRKIIWSEYAGCLRSLDCPEDMLCYPFEEYVNPPETDMSLLKCYHFSLNSRVLRTGTLPHKIATRHIEAVKARQK